MSLTSTMFTGASGLLNQAEGMSVIGNNISNVNTVGFKGSRMLFSDVLSTVIGNNSVGQIGHGVQIQKVDTQFNQSSMETSTSPTDLFIQGKDFFAVAAPGTLKGPVAATGAYYTRAGSFRLDTTGLNLINPDNFNVLDSQSNPIRFAPNSTSVFSPGTAAFPNPPVTGTAWAKTNMNPDIAGGATPYAPGDIASINGVNYICIAIPQPTVLGGSIYESPEIATTYWTRGTFDAAVAAGTGLVPPAPVAGPYAIGDVVSGANGANYVNITGQSGQVFDSTGAPVLDPAGNPTYLNPVLDPTNWELILDFQKVLSVSIKGEISLLYSDTLGNSATVFYNGSQQQPVSEKPGVFVGTARIPNPPGLVKVGGSLYRESGVITGGSGTPIMGSPNSTTEQIISSNLELSNVDLAMEFVKMIQTQRAYSANSKTITTSDEMLQEVLNLKR